MPRLYLYVPDDVAEAAKSRARATGKSLSSYLANLVVKDVADVAGRLRGRRWLERELITAEAGPGLNNRLSTVITSSFERATEER
jgi:hypothetical protein